MIGAIVGRGVIINILLALYDFIAMFISDEIGERIGYFIAELNNLIIIIICLHALNICF